MDAYTTWVAAHSLTAAAVQFGLLGTLGEIISHLIVTRRPGLPCGLGALLAKILGWAVLGVIIKYGFTGMKGFTSALLDHQLLPAMCSNGLGRAFAVSVLTNTFFGPQMMAFHRLTDNLILRRRGFAGLQRAWWTLLWFWIPAHTLTFSLPQDYQVGLAAVWSVVLGIILGLSGAQGPRRAR